MAFKAVLTFLEKYRSEIKFSMHLMIAAFGLILPLSKAVISGGYITLLILSIALARKSDFVNIHKRFRFGALVWSLIVLLGISLLYSRPGGFDVLFSQKGLVVLPLILWLNRDLVKKHWRLYLSTLVIGSLISGLSVLYFYFLPTDRMYEIVNGLGFFRDLPPMTDQAEKFGAYSPFSDRLHLSYMVGMSLLISAYFISTGFKRGMFILAFVLLTIVLAILGARGSQLAILAAMFIWIGSYGAGWVRNRFHLSPVLSNVGIHLVLGFVLITFMQLIYSNVSAVKNRYDQMKWEIRTYQDNTYKPEELIHYTTVRRIESWKYSAQLFKQHPIIGLGIGDFVKEMERLYNENDVIVPVHANNQFLFYGVSVGILGLLMLPIILIDWLRTCKTAFKGFSGALVAYIVVVFLLDSPLNYISGNLLFSYVFGILCIRVLSNKTFAN